MKRYLVLVHLAAAFQKTELAARATALHAGMKTALGPMETVLTSDKAFGFACVSAKPARDLWQSIVGAGLFGQQDNISVIEVGPDICTTHHGLMDWHQQTDLAACLAESARTK